MTVCPLLKNCSVSEELNVKWFCQQNLAPPWAVLLVVLKYTPEHSGKAITSALGSLWSRYSTASSGSQLSPAGWHFEKNLDCKWPWLPGSCKDICFPGLGLSFYLLVTFDSWERICTHTQRMYMHMHKLMWYFIWEVHCQIFTWWLRKLLL